MKLFRFLTTLLIIQLFTIGTQVSTQDITHFEIRKSSPSIPFLPSNQCRQFVDVFSPSQRCGFSAGLENESGMGQLYTEDLKTRNQIDLSPSSLQSRKPTDFQHWGIFHSFGTAKPAHPPVAKPNMNRWQHYEISTGQTFKKTTVSFFGATTSLENAINELIVEPVWISNQLPDIDSGSPAKTKLLQPPNLGVIHGSYYWSRAKSWLAELYLHRILAKTMEVATDQWAGLECRLWGTPAEHLTHQIRRSVQNAKSQIDHETELTKIQQNLVALNGIAGVTKMMGQSLIGISESIARISSKKVEVDRVRGLDLFEQ
ncbi:MAG: hypothetical protein VX438_02455 [Planctomycetota bacterium]|nr:hypothetical protein [Planctomycetota bacterium]